MGTRIRFVDLHYKGVLISQKWKNLFWNVFLGCWLVLVLLGMVLLFKVNGETFDLFETGNVSDWLVKIAKYYVLPCVVVSGVLMILILFIFYPVWNYFSDLQKICRIIYTYPLYIVRDYISAGAFEKESSVKMVKNIEYFPRFFYRTKKGNVEITVELDGSKFHQDESFENLNKVLEERFVLNVVNMTQRREYLTYHLFRDVEQHRLKMEETKSNRYSIPLMKDVAWEIDKIPHALVVGETGGGKTVFLNILIRSFLQMKAIVYICDPKNSSLVDYKKVLPNVSSDKVGIQKNVEDCVLSMRERYAQVKGHEAYIPGQDFTHYDLPPIVLIMDEYTAYMAMLVEKKEKDEFKASMSQLVLQGREAGVFLLLATQRPDAAQLDGSIRDQLGLRIVLGGMSEDGKRMAFGSTKQKLGRYGGRGKGYFYMSGFSFIQKFCAPLVPEGYHFVEEAKKLL